VSELERLRARIRELDEAIIRLLAQRFERVRALGACKAEENLPIEDEIREAELRALYARIAEREGVDPALVQRIFAAILAESKSVQRAARRSKRA
jgi:chorismate mutase